MRRPPGVAARGVVQALGVAGIVGLLSIIAHKGYADVAALAAKFSGQEFRLRLARYVVANLAG